MHSPILAPVVALAAWSMVVLLWLYARRLPAMRAANIDLKGLVGSRPGQLDKVVEPRAQWPAHNYMHLMEQPTVFYAVAMVLALTGNGDGAGVALAWAYVGLRVAHSLVQVIWNRVMVRFLLFAASSLVLIALTLLAVAAVA